MYNIVYTMSFKFHYFNMFITNPSADCYTHSVSVEDHYAHKWIWLTSCMLSKGAAGDVMFLW